MRPLMRLAIPFLSLLWILAPLRPPLVLATSLPVVVDGLYPDWNGVPESHTDPSGDGGSSGVDFARIWLADDTRFLFLRFEVGEEISLDENNALILYLDTDANASTGLAIGGIGAELEWKLGQRQGTYYRSGQTWPVFHDNIRFHSMPTVTSTAFEAAFGRTTTPNGTDPLFFGLQVRILLRDTASGGDWLPNSGQTLSYVMDAGVLPPETPIPLGREQAGDLRVSSLNVLNDSPWNSGQAARFGRLFAAVRPDVLAFQEIYDHTPQQTATLVESWLPSGPGQAWHAAGHADCHVISRYPVEASWTLDGNVGVLLNTTAVLGTKTLLINTHLPCCTDDSGRQEEVDRILSFLRDAKTPGGLLELPGGTPMLAVGDMNFVGLAQQITSLLTGDIVDEATFGEDFAPDWDGTPLMNLISRQTELRMSYTWRSDQSSFWPGHLDYVVYSDSALRSGNHYILYTPEMSADSLAAYGLLPNDSSATDHLLTIADFRPATPTDSEESGNGLDSDLRLRLAPNPSPGGATLHFSLPRASQVRVEVFDGAGRRVASPAGGEWLELSAGAFRYPWSGRGDSGRPLSPGTYFVRLRARHADGTLSTSIRWTRLL